MTSRLRTGGIAVAAGALLVAGCAPDAAAPAAAGPSTTPTPASASPSPTPTPGTAAGTDFGYFRRVESASAPVRLSFDRAIFLGGEEANTAAAAHGDETPVPNDFYIVNDNELLRTVTLAAKVKVTGSLALNQYAGDESAVAPESRTLEQLVGFLGTRLGRVTPFHLVYGRDGVVVSVEEQYIP